MAKPLRLGSVRLSPSAQLLPYPGYLVADALNAGADLAPVQCAAPKRVIELIRGARHPLEFITKPAATAEFADLQTDSPHSAIQIVELVSDTIVPSDTNGGLSYEARNINPGVVALRRRVVR